ncbi:valine--tRNA ligase [Sphingomonas sp. SM33]|uniref:Valine--tRNA ligase n=1 Tax=Sphingomonas telluris TaxID=2907998 RepID=A0ABS9VNR9_9SPHN|nr:valine--tRNA ligase [Sphingomonas telluris]MCH8616037.1 valine--tRNA ligase [Sphingomonas telluris]
MSELPKTFDPAAIEQRWYEHWESRGLFRPDRPNEEPWTIVMPPPNVTGSLHIGHALDNTLQDVLTRRERMRGKDALWVVGMDHAGIATQMVVERNLAAEGIARAELGRDEFVSRVWQWKEESGGQITRQLRRLGASCDWSHERFTMDPGFSKAVIKVFVELYKRGRIYRDKRLVNWDPKFQTAISDLEVETREVQGQFWTLRYPLADDARTGTGSSHIKVATTRPETMLADMAVAVHPDDERYKELIGKNIKHPITGRLIPIIADEHADPELGSGAVKITPGHDFNDYEVGKRAGFAPRDMLNMFDATAHVVQTQDGLIPQELLGLSREEARKQVLDMLMAGGFLAKVEDRAIPTPYGDRSGVVIEPWLTDQWYVDVKPMAERVLDATRSGDIKIVPETWSKTWFNWLENIQPWCVSRQLWWGHRIPAWYADDGSVFVAESEEEAKAQAGDQPLRRDPDVLDTWFSSALWPFATLGWPEQTHDLKRHYPNDVLISGFDIIFFWDARMAMQGLEFMNDVPWRTLYLHGLVRDAKGQKMSKSKGNTVDPLGIVDKYGADALRFTLAAMESQGRDIKLDEKRVEGYRNFATKLWNAARFLQMNGVGASDSIAAPAAELPVNRWIIGEVVDTLAKLDTAFDELRFDEMADAIYHFVWGTFCDWYVELVKGAFDEETKRVAAWAFDQILVMLHPFMPFVTEELWNANERPYDLIVAKWPEPQAEANPIVGTVGNEVVDVQAEMHWVIETIMAVRAAKNEVGIAPGQRLPAYLEDISSSLWKRLPAAQSMFERVGRIDIHTSEEVPSGSALRIPAPGATLVIPLEGVIDVEAERSRLLKSAAAAEKERDSLAGRLSNPQFAERAKPEAVEKARSDHAEKSAEAERYRAALERLG